MARADTEPDNAASVDLTLAGAATLRGPAGARVALGPRDAAMLAWLALEGATPRIKLAALVWPDHDLDAARNNLRQRLFKLRKLAGAEVIGGSTTLRLAPGVEHDLEDAEGLLADVPDEVGGEFSIWLAQQRERRRERVRHALVELVEMAEAAKDYADALTHAKELLALEPLSEDAHRRVIRLHYLNGDRAAALMAFDRCEQMLKDEVGTSPSAETLALLESLNKTAPLTGGFMRAVPASILRPPRLVGRDLEWALLREAWARGDAIVVIGEAGMGKTRLLGDLIRAHAEAPGWALQVSARPGDERVPYALLGRMLRGLLAARTEDLAAGVQVELGRLLPEMQHPQGFIGSHDPGAEARFVIAIEAVLNDAVISGLHTVALDDLHFADTASLEMAQHLVCTQGPRWLAALRGAEMGPAAQGLVETLTARLRATNVLLHPLTGGQVGELVESLGIAIGELPTLATALHRYTGGNPLFLLESLKVLVQHGYSAIDAPEQPSTFARLMAGSTAVRLIERRMSQLSRDGIRLARCAAVAGQDFSAELAARVLDENPLDLSDAWNELETAQFMRDGTFAHDLILEAARRSVPDPIARALHRRIAERLVDARAAPARLAEHWLGAGEPLLAAPHLGEAGRLALRALRIREGLDYLEQAQAIYGRAGNVDAQCALIDELITPAIMATSFASVLRLVEQATSQATTDRQRSMTLRSLASLLEQRREFVRAAEVCRESLAAALAARDRVCELRARALLAEVLGQLGKAAEAQAILEPIERWVNESATAEQRLDYAAAMATVLTECGNLTAALEQWQRAIDLARAHGAGHALPNLLMVRAITLVFTGRAQEGRDALSEGRQLLQDIPEDAMVLRNFNTRLQIIDRTLGHYTSSLALGELVLADAASGPQEIDAVRLPLAFAFCDLGQPARARQQLSLARASADSPEALFWHEVGAQVPQEGASLEAARRSALEAAAGAVEKWTGRHLLTAFRIQARHAEDPVAVPAARLGVQVASDNGMRGQQLVFQALLAQRLVRLGNTTDAVCLAKDSWRLLAHFCPGLMYRGVVWRALIEVLEPHDESLCMTVAHSAASWIFRTAAEHVPPAYRESFLHRNPFNQFVLDTVRAR